MEATSMNLQRHNLTGQVRIVDGIAKFNGNYSSVLLGTLNGRYVAIKVIKATSGQQTSTVQRKLLREVFVWGSTTHRNIHSFYGFATDHAFGPFGALISPWCSNGDANQYLSQNGPSMLVDTRVNLWKGVIEGVAYLHGSNPPIVHGDLKPGNVLIDDAGQPKLCDFGLARMLATMEGSGMTTTSEHTGTTRYLAPELVNSDESVLPTISSDLYALGCLGLDFVYLQIPFSHWSSSRQGHIKILQDLKRGAAPAAAPPRHPWPSQRLWPTISRLWSLDPLIRPSALATAQAVKRTVITFPPSVVQKIITLVDATEIVSYPRAAWTTRTRCLRNLCLVSRAYCTWATPALYRNLWLGRHDMAGTLLALNGALSSSITSPLAFNRITDGYGMHTERVVISATDSFHRGFLATEFRYLVQMMPRLHLVHIGNDHQMPTLHSLATLNIYYEFSHIFFVDPLTIILAFSYLQRLSILVTYYVDREPAFPGASSRLFLPHLRVVKIYSVLDEKLPDVSAILFLEALSGWILPSLQNLEIESRAAGNYTNDLIGFLSAHGSKIIYLTFEFIHDGIDISQDLCGRILTLCTNLQFMQVLLRLPAFQLPFHPNLKRFNVSWYESGNWGVDETSEVYERFKVFKTMAQTLFSNLVEAKGENLDTGWEASFNTGDEFITCVAGKSSRVHL